MKLLTFPLLICGHAREESDLFDASLFQDPMEPQKNGVELGKDQDCFSLMPRDDVEEDRLFLRELVGLLLAGYSFSTYPFRLRAARYYKTKKLVNREFETD